MQTLPPTIQPPLQYRAPLQYSPPYSADPPTTVQTPPLQTRNAPRSAQMISAPRAAHTALVDYTEGEAARLHSARLCDCETVTAETYQSHSVATREGDLCGRVPGLPTGWVSLRCGSHPLCKAKQLQPAVCYLGCLPVTMPCCPLSLPSLQSRRGAPA